MAAGNPNWWSLNHMHPSTIPSSAPSPSLFTSQYAPDQSSLQAFNPLSDHNQDFPQSWSQMLMGGLVGEEDRVEGVSQFESKKLENWDIKEESRQLHSHGDDDQSQAYTSSWSQPMPLLPILSTTNILELDFSTTNRADGKNQNPDYLSECNRRVNGGMSKKPRLDQPSSTQPPLKVRKEKLGDRITALHQLVSPFGKTDTASVLLEAIGCIRFLQSQIEALSSPYLGNASTNMRHQHQYQHSLLNGSCLKRREASKQDRQQDEAKDLRSRGLCLVPVSCTDIHNMHVGSSNVDNGADCWATTLSGGF